jgi:hypothetical protein
MTHRLLADALHTTALVLGLIGMIRDVEALNADLPVRSPFWRSTRRARRSNSPAVATAGLSS